MVIDNQNKKFCLNCNDCIAVCPRDAIFKDNVADIGVEGNILSKDFTFNSEQFINFLLNLRPVRSFTPGALTAEQKQYLGKVAALAPRNGYTGAIRNTGIILVEDPELLAEIEKYTYHYLVRLKKSLVSVWQKLLNLVNPALRSNIAATLVQIDSTMDAYKRGINLLTFGSANLLLLHCRRGEPAAGENLTMMGYQLILGAEAIDLGSSFLGWVSFALQSVMLKRSGELQKIYQKLNIPKHREIRSVFAIGAKQTRYRKLRELDGEESGITVF